MVLTCPGETIIYVRDLLDLVEMVCHRFLERATILCKSSKIFKEWWSTPNRGGGER